MGKGRLSSPAHFFWLGAGCLDKACVFKSLTNMARKHPDLSLSLYFQLLAVIQIIKTNHEKLSATLSFCSQPTSWAEETGLEWEAGSGQCHQEEEMKTGSERGKPQKKEK